jgi:hypothetical protein
VLKLRRTAVAVALALGLTAADHAPAEAQFSSVANARSDTYSPQQLAAFSKTIENELASHGARVAMVFRAGARRSTLPKGISYTHGAFWVYRTIATNDGRTLHGYAVYNLFAGDGKQWPGTESRLVQDWPYDFTAGTTVDDVAIIIPTPEMQRRLLARIDSPDYSRLHNPRYSLIANPLSDKYQNCNSFMLDIVASAAWDTTDPAQIRADLKAHFQPTKVEVGPLKRLFAPLADSRLRTDDQPADIVTATFESLGAFMHANGLSDREYVFRLTS